MAKRLTIIAIFILGFVLRVWNLSSYPVSLSMDEAAIGYNAYSLLKTGHDEFNEFLPLAFRSAGDYKPPVNFYLTIPSIAFFGLNEFGIRFSTALIGSLTVIAFIYLLLAIGLKDKASIFGGFWLSILPWHIHFSRGTFESVTSLFFLILGATFFVNWSKKSSSKILAASSAVCFSISVWAYHAERLFVPILVTFLFFLYKPKKNIKLFFLVTLIFAIPFLKLTFFTPAIKERAASTSILRESSLSLALHSGYVSFSEKVFDNNTYLVFRHWLAKYLNYYDLRFWFWKGMQFTPPGFPDIGLLNFVDLPLFLVGIYAILKSKNVKLKSLSLFWFFAGPIPASITMNEQHPLRALTWLPFFGIVIASGFSYLLDNFKSKLIVFIYFVLLLISMFYCFDIYTNQFPRHFSEYWQYGYKDAVIYACNNQEKYDRIVISDTFGSDGPLNTGLPYLYFLTFCDWDRNLFLETGKHQPKIEFRRPNREDFSNKKALLIGSRWDFLDDLEGKGTTVKEIKYLNGKDAFLLVEP